MTTTPDQSNPVDRTNATAPRKSVGMLRSAWPVLAATGAGMATGYAAGRLLGQYADRFSQQHFGGPIPVARLVIPGGVLGLASGLAYAKARQTALEAFEQDRDARSRNA